MEMCTVNQEYLIVILFIQICKIPIYKNHHNIYFKRDSYVRVVRSISPACLVIVDIGIWLIKLILNFTQTTNCKYRSAKKLKQSFLSQRKKKQEFYSQFKLNFQRSGAPRSIRLDRVDSGRGAEPHNGLPDWPDGSAAD